MIALLIDGAYRMREMQLASKSTSEVRVPLYQPMTAAPPPSEPSPSFGEVATFAYICTLPNGRRVYGLREAGFQQWAVTAQWSEISAAASKGDVEAETEHELTKQIESICAGKYLELWAETTRDVAERIYTRRKMGIGKPRERAA